MNIMAVDDEPLALKSIARVIKKEISACEPVLFGTPEEALKYAKENLVDVAFLDIEMGGMSGLNLAKHLKDLNGKTNIVFTTGYSEYALPAHGLYPTGYLMKPITEKDLRKVMENLRNPLAPAPEKTDKRLRVQTFGNFEVFFDGKPVRFPRSKAKELLAYLIQKNGTSCTIRELTAVLFEDNSDKNIWPYISAMQKTLDETGVEGVIIKSYNSLAVDTSKFDCDLYRFLKMDAEAVNAYMGEYMAQYSWAELMTGHLDGKISSRI